MATPDGLNLRVSLQRTSDKWGVGGFGIMTFPDVGKGCMQGLLCKMKIPFLARALGQARATIGYLVYKGKGDGGL